MSDLKVTIMRHPQSYTKKGTISINEIFGVHWDCESGGIHRKQSGYSLYGYIDYSVGKELVDCSGQHDKGYNNMKICIPAKYNKGEAYKILLEEAGDKPRSRISIERPKGYPPCSRRILEILDDSPLTRKQLRAILLEDGYQKETIRNAINRLGKNLKLSFSGSSNSPKQIIQKNNALL